MSIEENKAVVRRFAEECWMAGKLDVLDEVVTEDLVRSGTPVGRQGMASLITMIRTALPDLTGTITDLIAEGDQVVWRYSSRGTHTGGPLFGVPPTGKVLTWTGTATLRLAGGKITEISDNVDMLAIYQQLGLVAVPGHPGG